MSSGGGRPHRATVAGSGDRTTVQSLVCSAWVLIGWTLHDLIWLASADLLVMAGRLVVPALWVMGLWLTLVTIAAVLRVEEGLVAGGLLLAVVAPAMANWAGHPIDVSEVWLRLPKVLAGLALAHWLVFRSRGARWPWLCAAGLGLSAAALLSLVTVGLDALSLHQGHVHAIVFLCGAAVWKTGRYDRSAGWRRPVAIGSAAAIATALVMHSKQEEAKLHQGEVSVTNASSGPIAVSDPASNVILIVLDNLSALRLPSHGHDRDTMPSLMRFAGRPDVREFLDARSASSWTIPSHGTLLTGLAAGRHGAHHVAVGRGVGFRKAIGPLRQEARTLAEELSARGYRTGAVVSNSYMLGPQFGFARGFGSFDHRDPELLSPLTGLLAQALGGAREVGSKPYYEAPVIFQRALSWLDAAESERPFFLLLNLMEAHAPWIPPAPYDALFGDESARPPLDLHPPHALRPLLYDRQIGYLDDHLGRFLARLEERSDFERTMVVITSDHGESFGQQDFWGHSVLLHEPLIRVPLIVKPALQSSGLSVPAGDLRAIDTWRWIARETGLPAFSPDRSNPVAEVYANRALRESAADNLYTNRLAWMVGGRKVVVSRGSGVEIFDLAADPLELTNLAEPESSAYYRELAKPWWRETLRN